LTLDETKDTDKNDLKPSEIARKIDERGIEKSKRKFLPTLVLSVLAGVFIGLGGIYFTFTTAEITINHTFTQIIGGISFSLGLILVVIAGADLFTGNNLMSISLLGKKISIAKLVRNWFIVYVGNFVGSVLIAFLLYLTNVWSNKEDGEFAIRAISIANHKVNLGFSDAFFLAILCNILVCMAIWLATSGRSVISKILAIVFPISAFVALGFEHSVANMYFISFALMLLENPNVPEMLQQSNALIDLSNLHMTGFLSNLLPVTLGNIAGGSIFIGFAYWISFIRK